MRFKLICWALFLFLPATGFGESFLLRAKNYWKIDAGVFADNINGRLNAPAGYGGEVSSVAAALRLRRGLSLGKNFFFEPAFTMVLPWRTDADGAVRIFPLMLDFNLVVPIRRFLNLRGGFGVYSLLFVGSGQAVTENNGNGTSTFYGPSGVTLSINIKPQLALDFLITSRLSFGIEAFVLNVMSQSRRSLGGLAVVGIRL